MAKTHRSSRTSSVNTRGAGDCEFSTFWLPFSSRTISFDMIFGILGSRIHELVTCSICTLTVQSSLCRVGNLFFIWSLCYFQSCAVTWLTYIFCQWRIVRVFWIHMHISNSNIKVWWCFFCRSLCFILPELMLAATNMIRESVMCGMGCFWIIFSGSPNSKSENSETKQWGCSSRFCFWSPRFANYNNFCN